MATDEAFKAAVNLIRSMPKEGPFQPSPHLMLRFYALFKQATEGKCTQPKPAFWAVVNKAKWDAWKCLGNMPKEEAMQKYVEELKQIVETMSYSENVANFMHVLGPFYEAVYDGQEPENLRRDSSPQPSSDAGTDKSSDHLEDESGYSSSINGTGTEETESADLESDNSKRREDDEEEEEEVVLDVGGSKASSTASFSSLYPSAEKFYSDAESDDEYKDPLPDHHTSSKTYQTMNSKPSSSGDSPSSSGEHIHVTMALQRLQADLKSISGRLDVLEQQQRMSSQADKDNSKLTKRSTVEQVGSFATVYSTIPNVNQLSLPSWFPFKDANLATIVVILGWPLVAQYLLNRLRHNRPTSAI